MIDSKVFRPLGAPPAGYPHAQAILEYGNINMLSRPSVVNADGSISTVRSIGISLSKSETGEKRTVHVLIPTVHDDGYIMSDDAATKLFKKTEKHLGVFSTIKDLLSVHVLSK